MAFALFLLCFLSACRHRQTNPISVSGGGYGGYWLFEDSALNKYTDLAQPVSNMPKLYYCPEQFDTAIEIKNRALPDYAEARKILDSYLALAKTDIDTLRLCRIFMRRVFDNYRGSANDYPGYAVWRGLTLEQQYNYGKGDSGKIQCDYIAQSMTLLLRELGFTDMVEVSYKNLHNFLLVKTRNGSAWLADGYSTHIFCVRGKEVDFITYLKLAATHPDSLTAWDLPVLFGNPDMLIDKKTGNALLQCGAWDNYLDTALVKLPPQQMNKTNIKQWLPAFFHCNNHIPGQATYKLNINKPYSWFSSVNRAGCPANAITLWLCTTEVSIAAVSGSDQVWADSVKQAYLQALGR